MSKRKILFFRNARLSYCGFIVKSDVFSNVAAFKHLNNMTESNPVVADRNNGCKYKN